jgi:hypothetical protein
MDLEIKDFSQWFPGRLNNVADSLSRDFHLSDEKLTTYLRSFFPSQIPSSFTIVPLPNEIVLWLISLLQRLPVNKLFREEHMPTKHSLGNVGSSTANQSALILTSSSTGSVEKTDTKSSEHSQSHCEKDDFRNQLALPWVLKQFEAPSITWSRPSGKTIVETQPLTQTVDSPGP